MRAAIFQGPGAVGVGECPDPAIQAPTDAVVRVALSCVCGSDLWYYRGESPHAVGSVGHELIGVVEETGAGVDTVSAGPAPARIFIPALMTDVLEGTIDPGRVFDYETDLDHVADAYRAMDDRRAIKSLVRVGSL